MAQLLQTSSKKKWKTSFLSKDQKVVSVIQLFSDYLSANIRVNSTIMFMPKLMDTLLLSMYWTSALHSQVTIGEVSKCPGLKTGVRCLWDAESDDYATAEFENEHIFCFALVFGVKSY